MNRKMNMPKKMQITNKKECPKCKSFDIVKTGSIWRTDVIDDSNQDKDAIYECKDCGNRFIFLALIPLGIWGAFIDLAKAVDSSLKGITKVVKEGTGKDIDDQIKKAKKLTILGILPLVVVSIFSLAILVMIFLIWKIDLVGLLIKII